MQLFLSLNYKRFGGEVENNFNGMCFLPLPELQNSSEEVAGDNWLSPLVTCMPQSVLTLVSGGFPKPTLSLS